MALVAAGCGSSDDGAGDGAAASGGSSTQAAVKQTKITYRGPFLTSGSDAPFYYAQKLGYYRQEGIDVEIRDSKGSAQTAVDVSNGGSDVGEINATNLMLAVAQGQKLTSVATTLGKSSFGFFVPKDSGVTSIKGLQGQSVAATALAAPNLQAALTAGGLSKSDVKPVFADAASLITTYLSKKVGSMYTTAVFLPATQRRPSNVLLQADAGYNPPDYALVVRQDMLEKRPDVVRGFVRATLRGFEAAQKNPAAAIDALLAKHPELERQQAIGTLKAIGQFYCSAAQKGTPYGQNAGGDWSTAAAALKRFAGMSGSADGKRFFTNVLFAGQDGIHAGDC